jgi:ADP-ribose pyrophosphatase YjhB (NUDIX family)
MDQPAHRRASRLVVLDKERRVLLFLHARSNGESFWAPPGGGLENDETFQEAALREAAEELGMADLSMTLLWKRSTSFFHMDYLVDQEECFFLLEGELPEPSTQVKKIWEREGILKTKWWSIQELESTKETLFPEDLPSQLRKNFNSSDRTG